MVARIKKNDVVIVISGKDKGKKGAVLEIVPGKNLVRVKDVALVTRHVKARRQGEVSGVKKEESFISFSKVMPVCDGLPTRVNCDVLSDGKKVRVSNKNKTQF